MMTTIKQDIIACFGKPTDYEFDITRFLGKNRGRLNTVGLRYQGLIVAGTNLRKVVEERMGKEYVHWEFMYHIQEWCEEYTQIQEPLEFSKDGTIHKGQLFISSNGNGTYFCVPPELNLTAEVFRETG